MRRPWPLLLLVVVGCTSTPPLIDPKASKTPEALYSDWSECRTIVAQAGGTWSSVGLGAATGAALGAGVGYGSKSAGLEQVQKYDTVEVVGAGAVAGVLAGAITGWIFAGAKEDVRIIQCLEGRGYRVIQ